MISIVYGLPKAIPPLLQNYIVFHFVIALSFLMDIALSGAKSVFIVPIFSDLNALGNICC